MGFSSWGMDINAATFLICLCWYIDARMNLYVCDSRVIPQLILVSFALNDLESCYFRIQSVQIVDDKVDMDIDRGNSHITCTMRSRVYMYHRCMCMIQSLQILSMVYQLDGEELMHDIPNICSQHNNHFPFIFINCQCGMVQNFLLQFATHSMLMHVHMIVGETTPMFNLGIHFPTRPEMKNHRASMEDEPRCW